MYRLFPCQILRDFLPFISCCINTQNTPLCFGVALNQLEIHRSQLATLSVVVRHVAIFHIHFVSQIIHASWQLIIFIVKKSRPKVSRRIYIALC